MAGAFNLFRSFLTGRFFKHNSKAKVTSFRPSLLSLESRVTPAIIDLSGANNWTPIMIGATKDYSNDSQAGAADTDIIGDSTHGSLYTAFDDNNTANTTDDTLVFRMRINNPTSTTNFAGVAIVGMDANQDGRVDIFMSVDGRNNGRAIRIFDPGSGLNNSPNTTTTTPLPVGILPNNGVYYFNANNYSVVPVSATSDPNWNGQTDGLNGLNFGGNDAFISWRLPISDLATVLAKPSPVDRSGNYGPRGSSGIAGFNKDTVVQYVNFTQTQTGPINGDLNGAPRNYDGAFTFSGLGVTTTPMSASNPVAAATVVTINEPIGDGNISASESTAITISGTTNAPVGSTVQLTITDSSSGTTDVIATATVISGSNGANTWSVSNVNISSQVDGSLTVTAAVTVNSITSTNTASVLLDKTGPASAINTLQTALSGKPTFTGTSDLPVGSTLTITIDPDNDPATANNIVYTTSVQSGGTWSLDTSLQAPISGTMPSGDLVSFSKVTVSGTDAAGNQSTATILNRPTVYTLSTNDTTPLVGGTWTNISGDVLSVTVNGVPYIPIISGNTWTVQVTNALAAGSTYQVVATVTRGASSVNDATTGELAINSTPVVTIGINGGSSSTTSNTLPTISGNSNITSGTIIVQIDPNNDGNLADAVTYSVTTDSSGNWSLNTGNTANLISGSIPSNGYSGTINVYAENIAGTATAEQSLTVVTPTVAISSITSGATTNGFATVNNTGAAANYLNMTEDDSVTVTGTAPDGYTVDLVIRDPNGNFVSQNGITVSSGSWTVSGLNLSTLDDGVLTVTATLSGTIVNTTNTSVTHDKTAPRIFNTTQSTVQKTSGAVYKGNSELAAGTQISVGLYSDSNYTNLDHTLLTTTVDAQGNWSVTTTSNLNNSTNPVYVRVQPVNQTTDAAGNIVQKNDSSRVVSQSQGNVSALINVYPVTGDNLIVLGEIGSGITIAGDTNQTSRTVTVTVTDGTTTITKTATSGSTYTSGTQNWSVSITNAEVKSLKNGQLTVTGSVADANSVSVTDVELPTLNLPSPVLSITDNVPGVVTGNGTVIFTFSFTEGVTGFDATDVAVANGTKGTFSTVNSSTYTLEVTPTSNSNGTMIVSVASGSAAGVNTGRGNTAASRTQDFNTTAAASVPTITIDIDGLATNPTPIISGTTSLAAGAPVIVTIDPDNDSTTTNSVTYSATVQSGGTWSVNTSTETPDTGVVPFEGFAKYAQITATATNAFGLSASVTGLNKPAVNTLITNTTTPTVTGTWANISGDSLTVTVNNISYTPTISGNTWSVAVTNALSTGASYEVVATVTRSSTSKVDITSNEVTIDTTAPTVAITSITTDSGTAGDFKTNDTTLAYTGTAENNATVQLTLRDSQNNLVFSTSVIASGGNWSLDRTGFPLLEGSYSLTAVGVDAAGNTATATRAIVVDLTGPIIAFTSGRSTNSSTPYITGTTDLPVGSTITIKVDHDNDGDYAEAGTATHTTTVQAGGLWSVQATTAISGTVGVQASGTDEVGNTTTITQPLTLNANIPVITISEPIDAAGNGNGTLDASEDNSVVISGTSTNVTNGGLITVTITDGNSTITDTAIVSNNSWSLAALNLSSLANGTIFVTADYLHTNGELYSDNASVLHDKTAGGAITIDSISQDTGIIADFITNDQTLSFTGSTTANASVTVVIKDSSNNVVQTFAAVLANAGGTYVTPVSNTLGAGNYTVEATTGANTASQAITVDLTAPNVPTVNSLITTNTSPTITGTVTLAAGDVLRVTVDGVTYSVGNDLTVNSGAGTWSLQIPVANALHGGTFSVTATVTDIAGNVSTDTTSNELVVNTINPDPVVTTTVGTTNFTEGNNTTSTPVVVDAGITVTDPDSSTLASATVTISNGFQTGQDVLAFSNTNSTTFGNISASYSAGVLLLTSTNATATIAQWQSALSAVTYTNSSETPNTSNRTISFVVNDGTNNSNTATKQVSITAVNDAPIVTTSAGTIAFTEGNNVTSTPVVVDSGVTVSDADNSTLASATVSITTNFQASEDLLAFTNSNSTNYGNISPSYNSSTGVLTLTSSGATATVAQWQAALQAITYTNSSDTPNTSTKTISFRVNDGNSNSNTATRDLSVTATNDMPTVANPIQDQNATEDSPFSFQFSTGTFRDMDGNPLTYTAQLNGGGALPNWLTFTPSTRTFSGTPANADVGTISIDVITNDGNGGTVTDTFNIVVANVNDPPTVANPIPNQNATEDSLFSFQFLSNTFADEDAGDILSYAAQLNGGGALPNWLNFDPTTRTFSGTPSNSDVGTISIDVTADDGHGGTVTDTFNIVVANANDQPTIANPIPDQIATENIPFSYQFPSNTFTDADVGDTLTYTALLNGGSTLPNWLGFNATNRTFSGTPLNTDLGTISIDVTANDGNGGTVTETFNLVVGPTNANPVVTTSAGTTSFTEGDNTPSTPVLVDSGVQVSDSNNSTLASATVTITVGFQTTEDVLEFTNTNSTIFGDISATYNSGTGVLSLTSSDGSTISNWQSALQAVRYKNSSQTPNISARVISFVVNDGSTNSNTATKNVSVSAINDAPIVNAPATIQVTEDAISDLTGISFSDQDAGSGQVTASFSVPSGTLYATSGGGVTVLSSGTGNLTLSGSLVNINTFIASNNLSFQTAANNTATVTLTIGINDNGNSGGSAQTNSTTVNLQVISVPDVMNVTSSTSDGYYKAGDVITVTVQFDEPVNVNTLGGIPYLVLETGTIDRNAVYTSGSGTSTLTFTYTVQPGDATADLDYVSSSSLVLNGGTIKNIATRDATLTLANPGAISSLGANKAIVIDTTPPSVGPIDITTGTDSGPDDTTTNHGNPVITFTGEAGLTISLLGADGTPLTLGTQYTVSYSNGTYTVTLLDADGISGNGNQPFGTYSNGTLTGNGTSNGDGLYTIKATDLAGNQSTVGTFTIDTTPPSVSPIITPTGLGVNLWHPTLTFTGEPGLTITLAGPNGGLLDQSQYTVTYATGTYTVSLVDATLGSGGNNDPFGTYAGQTPTNNSGNSSDGLYTIVARDLAGNQATVGTFNIDTTRPTVAITSNITSLALGATAVLTITFSEVPLGFTLSDISVTSGSVTSLAPTNDPKVFTANYMAPNGSGGTESISISNGSYTDLADNNGLGTTLNQQITVIAPTLVITSDRPNLEFGQTAILTFTFSEVPVGFAVSDISITNGSLGALVANPNNPRIYTVVYTPSREFIGTGTISVANGAYTNAFNIAGVGASISPPISIYTKIRGFAATGDGSSAGGSRLNPNQNANGTSVVLYDPVTGASSGSTVPFDNYKGQVRVSRADTNGDGVLDMVVSTGAGGEPVVKIIDSSNGNLLGQIIAYDPAFSGGVYVSVIDINQDGYSEIVTGAGTGGGPHVKVFDGRTRQEIASFFAYDPGFRGGVTVATKDLDGDGILDIVTGAGPGGGPHVRVYNGATMSLMQEFMAYDVNFTGGVFVAVGDFMSDGRLEIITGAGAGGGPHVKIWDYLTLNLIAEKMAYDNYTYPSGLVVDMLFSGGARVGLADGNDDGLNDLIVGAGPGGGPHVKVLAGFNLETIRNFFSGEISDSRGVFVSQ